MDKRIYIPGETKGREPIVDYNQLYVTDSEDNNIAKIEFWMAKEIGTKLMAEYPNRQWAVDVDARNKVVIVMCPSLSTRRGFHIHIQGLTLKQIQIKAVRAAGEILERFGVTRGRKQDPNEFDHLPQTVRDEVIAKDAAPDPLYKPER